MEHPNVDSFKSLEGSNMKLDNPRLVKSEPGRENN